jgi:TPR repeat protein
MAWHGKVVSLAESLWARGDRAWDLGHLDAAERLLGRAAAMGDASAMNSFASLLDDHLHRPEEALVWYERAVEAGSEIAAWNLAMHYVPLKNAELYRHWMRKAAEMGFEDAAVEVAKFARDPDHMTKLPLEDCE